MRLAVLAALAALLTGCGGASSAAPKESASTFIERVLRQELSGRYDDAWESLYPGQQKVGPKDLFVRCQAGSPRAPIVRMKVLQVRREPLDRPGVAEKEWTAV